MKTIRIDSKEAEDYINKKMEEANQEKQEKQEKQELNHEDIRADARAFTEFSEKFCKSMQAVADAINETFQKPEFKALLASLPEPEPEKEGDEDKRIVYVCTEYKQENCDSRCRLEFTQSDVFKCVPKYCPFDHTSPEVAWEATNEQIDEEEHEEEDPLSICPDLLSHAASFSIGDFHIQIKTLVGVNRWAIYNISGEVYRAGNFNGFVWEPQPSDRTKKHLAETRFTLAEALRIVERLKK